LTGSSNLSAIHKKEINAKITSALLSYNLIYAVIEKYGSFSIINKSNVVGHLKKYIFGYMG